MERKKRSLYDIIYDILTSCKPRIKKTRLMYNANLSFQVTEKYIMTLSEKGLIFKKEDKFSITEKGMKYLEVLRNLRDKRQELEEIYSKLKELI